MLVARVQTLVAQLSGAMYEEKNRYIWVRLAKTNFVIF